MKHRHRYYKMGTAKYCRGCKTLWMPNGKGWTKLPPIGITVALFS